LTESAGTGVGAELSRARQARGLALADIAQQLKFAPRQLEALEQERFELLPGSTFARGMVRSYARLLKLDPEPLLGRIAGRFDAPDASRLAARYSEPVPFSDNARRSTTVYLGLSLGILAVVGAVTYEWYHERNATRQPFVSAARPLPIPAQPAAATPAPLPKMEKTPPVEELAVVEEKMEAPKLEPGTHRLVLRCEREAWLEVRDGNGRLLVSSLNPAGSERVVQGRPPFTLVIGNAQHVHVTYNDRAVDLQPFTKVQVARLTLK